jgi:hypothetical protein
MTTNPKGRKPEIHPAADADIDRHYNWLRDHFCTPVTLHKFLDAVEEAKAKICDNAATWSRASGSKKVRKVQIKSFRMTAFYVIQRNGVPLILEFARPGMLPRWAKRL